MTTSAERILILMSMLDDLKKMKEELKKEPEKKEEKPSKDAPDWDSLKFKNSRDPEELLGIPWVSFETALCNLKNDYQNFGDSTELLGITCETWCEDELLFIDPEEEKLRRGYHVANELFTSDDCEEDEFYIDSDDILYNKWRVIVAE